MKYILIILSIFFLGCNLNSDRPVETEPQTSECLIGKWAPENVDQMPYNEYNFTADMEGSRFENQRFKIRAIIQNGEEREISGSWKVTSTGHVDADLSSNGEISITMINCGRFVAGGKTIYVKK